MGAVQPLTLSPVPLCFHPSHTHFPGTWGGVPVRGGCFRHAGTTGLLSASPHQIKVEFSMKFTSRDMSLKRTPSKKQTGVFGVKISVVTK